MVLVHIGLHLEDEPGYIRVVGLDRFGLSRLRLRRRRPARNGVEQVDHGEAADGGAEKHRCQMSGAVKLEIELRRQLARQFQPFETMVPVAIPEAGLGLLFEFGNGFRLGFAMWVDDPSGHQIKHALQPNAHADRPVGRGDVERQRVGDLVENLQRVAALAVDLVDEGDDRDVAQPADLEQLERLRLDAARCVDDHDGAVDGGQGPVGVLGKIGVGRVCRGG